MGATCIMCARSIEKRDRDDCHCYGCGAFVCKLCVHIVIWEHDGELPGGTHSAADHETQATALGISVDAGK